MTNIKPHTIAIAEIEYQPSKDRKTRPVYVLTTSDDSITVFRITSVFNTKSDYIKSHYFELFDWKKARLMKPSWIDTLTTVTLHLDTIRINYIGTLSAKDEERLTEWLEQRSTL